jgi:hypothetical protein
MTQYKISGVWKEDGVISHYAIHQLLPNGRFTKGAKTSKTDAVRLLNNLQNKAVTWLWDYRVADWKDGQNVEVVNGSYLRSDPDNKLTDNLGHLINYQWI